MSAASLVRLSCVGAVLLMPAAAAAQAVCSAPHSSPTLAQSGAIATLPAGAGWIQLSLLGQRADEAFGPTGGRQDFAGSATFDTRSAYLTGAVGVGAGLEVWAQMPVHRLRVTGPAGASRSSGLGDLRGAVRLSPALLDLEWPVALRAGVKIPGSDFPVDATELPLTEGQRDVELSVESGWASPDRPFYLVGWVGRRWRARNDGALFEPGDETFAHLAVGGFAGPVSLELGLDGLWGATPEEQGLALPGARRRLLQILPTVGSAVGPGRLEVTTPVSLAGRNLPATVGVSLGYRVTRGM